MSLSNPRIPCPLHTRSIRSTRCTEILLQRFGVAPDLGLRRIQKDTGLPRSKLEAICRSCAFNPVESPSDLDAGLEPLP